MLKRTRSAQLAGIVTGICTHLFLSGMVLRSGDVGPEYRSWWGDIFSVATTVFFISAILNKRWGDKLIELDASYREFSWNRDELIDNLRFDVLKSTETLFLSNYFLTWIFLGIIGGCLFDGFVYGI
jgi:hypothetical protein